MANVTTSVSGVSALRIVLAASNTYYFTNAVDGQKLRVTFQQAASGSGPFTVTSGNCPGIVQVASGAGQDTTFEMVWDSLNNTWIPLQSANNNGNAFFQTTTTATSLAWTRGIYGISGAAVTTLTITNPVSGPPGVGNDGEIMYFNVLTAHAHAVTMATTQTVNGSSTTITTAGVIGNAVALMAFAGNVYVIGSSGTITFT